jgi:signal recognition particle receptor subunit beta
MVMDFEEGSSLADWLQRLDAPPEESDLRRIFVPVLEGLGEVHRKRYLHRDIKPGNIFLRDRGPPCLLDFGAAEVEVGPARDSANVLTHGYAPIEQYNYRGPVGPASDIYALGATLYRCISGRIPADARSRQQALEGGRTDPLKSARKVGRGRYTRELLELIDWMTALHAEGRPRAVDQILDRLGVKLADRQRSTARSAGGLTVHHRLLFSGPAGAGKRSAIAALCDGPVSTRDARVAFGGQAPAGEALVYGRLLLPPHGQLHLYGIGTPDQARTLAAALDRGVLGLVILVDNGAENPLRALDFHVRLLERLPTGAGAAVGVTHTDLHPKPTVADYNAYLAQRSSRARVLPLPVFEVDTRSPREVGLLVQALLHSIEPGA